MRMQTRREHGFALSGHALGHHHRFGAGRGAIIHGRIGNIHAREERDLSLELKQGLQRALGNLWLIRRIGREKFRALDEVVNSRGYMVTIGPGSAEKRYTPRRRRLGRKPREIAFHLGL